MKANIITISASLMMLLIGFSSCQDSLSEKDQLRKEMHRKTGGDDTDGPIFVGLAMDIWENPVYPAVIELYEDGSEIALDSAFTEENGGFRFDLADSGSYFLKVYQNDELLATSETVEVTDSSYVVVQL